MTAQEANLIKTGGKWHRVEDTETDLRWGDVETTITTACQLDIAQRLIEDESEPGESPTGLSGTTVCYECARRTDV